MPVRQDRGGARAASVFTESALFFGFLAFPMAIRIYFA
jgi:hypothetical protein